MERSGTSDQVARDLIHGPGAQDPCMTDDGQEQQGARWCVEQVVCSGIAETSESDPAMVALDWSGIRTALIWAATSRFLCQATAYGLRAAGLGTRALGLMRRWWIEAGVRGTSEAAAWLGLPLPDWRAAAEGDHTVWQIPDHLQAQVLAQAGIGDGELRQLLPRGIADDPCTGLAGAPAATWGGDASADEEAAGQLALRLADHAA